MKTKICTKCQKELPMNSDYFHRNKNYKDGYRYDCKKCRGYKYTNKLNIKEGYKRCISCNKELILNSDNFYEAPQNKDGFQGKCILCEDIYQIQYNKKNKEKIKVRKKQYRKENRKVIKEYNKKYREENKEKIRKGQKKYYEKNKDSILEYRRIYGKLNPEIIRKGGQRRRARLNNLPHTLTTDEYEGTLNYFNNECAYCGMSEEEHLEEYGESLHQEHIVPISKGGGYVKENIIPSCRTCNASKNSSNFKTWYKQYEHYSDDRYNKILEFIKKYKEG